MKRSTEVRNQRATVRSMKWFSMVSEDDQPWPTEVEVNDEPEWELEEEEKLQ